MKKNHLAKRTLRTKNRSHSVGDVRDHTFFTKQIFLQFLFYVSSAVFVVSLLYTLFYAHFLRVRTFDIVNSDRVSPQQLEELAIQMLEGYNLFKMPKANLLLISADSLAKDLTSGFAEIEEISVEKVFPSTLRITVKEYDTIMVVCGTVLVQDALSEDRQTQEACMSVDQGGFRGEQEDLGSEKLQSNPTLIVRVDDLLPPNVGDTIFLPETRDRLFYIIEELPYRLSLRAVGEPRLTSLGSTHVEIITDEGWTLLLDLMHEPRISIRVLEAFFEQTRELDIRNNVAEIDIRLLDKIFYKKKGSDELVQEAPFDSDDQQNAVSPQAQDDFRDAQNDDGDVLEQVDSDGEDFGL